MEHIPVEVLLQVRQRVVGSAYIQKSQASSRGLKGQQSWTQGVGEFYLQQLFSMLRFL
jgi:hypothetical protein